MNLSIRHQPFMINRVTISVFCAKRLLGTKLLLIVALSFIGMLAHAQPNRTSREIKLTQEDTAAFPSAPMGFDQKRENIQKGTTETVTYYSKSVGAERRMTVYLPPGFSREKMYPVLYLMHGIGGNEKEWYRWSAPDVIFDNLLADGKIVPMIVVFPNGRAMKNDADTGNVFAAEKMAAFGHFENDLLKDVIPFIENKYPVTRARNSRALAGFSMGGGQSLNFGLSHPDVFAYVGGFSPAPNTRQPAVLLPDPEAVKKLNLLYVSCGSKDGLMSVSQHVHRCLKDNNIPHIYHIQPGGEHNIQMWINDLYHFSQRLFSQQ